jgi:hypothetical protein
MPKRIGMTLSIFNYTKIYITFDELDLLIISASKSFSGSQEEDQNVKS